MKKISIVKVRKNIPHSASVQKSSLSLDTVEVKIFQNKNNKQFNLPVLKRNTSPRIIQDILANKDIVGLKFKITDIILRDAVGKDIIFKNNIKGVGRMPSTSKARVGSAVNLLRVKGGRT